MPFQTPLQGWSPLFRSTQAKAWAMFSWPFGPYAWPFGPYAWPFGPYAEALGSMFGANHQVSWVFSTGC